MSIEKATLFQKAIIAIDEEGISIQKAARRFGLQHETLRRRYNKSTRVDASNGQRGILTPQEVNGILHGRCLTNAELSVLIRKIETSGQYQRSMAIGSRCSSWSMSMHFSLHCF